MGIFDLFKGVDINSELEEMKSMKDAVLLDVRTINEYSNGHIPGSINVPVEEISNIKNVISNLDTPVYVYCLRGSRSKSAVNSMKSMGYTNTKSIGGIASYKGRIESNG